MAYFFEPPTHEEPMRTSVRPLNYYRLTHADSVLKIGGQYVAVRNPSGDQLVGVEGVDYFIGGHVYDVDEATATALSTAGYTVGAFNQAPRGYTQGLMTRDTQNLDFFKPYIGSFVQEIKWNEIQPTSGGSLDTTIVNTVLANAAWAAANGKKIRIRFFAGKYTPSWVLALSGQMAWVNDSGVAQGNVPVWWNPTFHELDRDVHELMAAAFGSVEPIREITISQNMTIFAEPMLHQLSQDSNVTALRDNGYTVETDLAMMRSAIGAHKDIWVPTGIASSFSFNPWLNPTNLSQGLGGTTTQVQVTLDLMDYLRTTLGRFGVLMNNSIGAPISSRGTNYQTMWEYMQALRAETVPYPQPLAFQTMTMNDMKNIYFTTPYDTALMCANLGAHSQEGPVNWVTDATMKISLADSQYLNSLYLNNVTELL